MNAHVISGSAASATYPSKPDWLALSAAFGEEVPAIADRDDLIVSVEPGAGQGAPACFMPDLATIEVDGDHLDTGVNPATVAPHRVGDRVRYRTIWGLLTHECAHAAHSRWRVPDETPPGIAAAALLLEESRIEARQIHRRTSDRYWLRASAVNLILAETDATNPAKAPTMTATDAAQCASLLLARTDAGILTRQETTPVAEVVEQVLGADTLATLRTLWRTAHTTDDTDVETMIELGRQWCDAVGVDPNNPPLARDESGDGTGHPSALADAVASVTGTVSRAVASEPAPTDPITEKLNQQAVEEQARQHAEATAQTVFAPAKKTRRTRKQKTAITGTRSPSAAERTAARQLGRALTTAGVRDRAITRTTSALPPGRLQMRGALAADAQRAAGAIPTAEPFTRTTRTTVPAPPLRLGIACDVSGSMSSFTGPVASAAWILAHAAHHTNVPATTATVIFGHTVRPITYPGKPPRVVTNFAANDSDHAIDTAISALDGALELSSPGAARLLVIISDGIFEDYSKLPAQALLDRLRNTGCAVLWLAPAAAHVEPMKGATVHTLTAPTTTARAIGRAATTALRSVR